MILPLSTVYFISKLGIAFFLVYYLTNKQNTGQCDLQIVLHDRRLLTTSTICP